MSSWPKWYELHARWYELWERLSSNKYYCDDVEFIIGKYSENNRHYHTPKHLLDCFNVFDYVKHLCNNPDLVELALWFHDAEDKEYKSVGLLYEYLVSNHSLDFTFEQIREVMDLIMVTKHFDSSRKIVTIDQAIMSDVDLSILGSDSKAYKEYRENVRKEYKQYSDQEYAKGRIGVLNSFLNRERIYFILHEYENDARRNIASEIKLLSL